MTRRGLLAALIVALAAFGVYRATLLPGVDFGDTGSFQTMAGSALITPRDGYPLYFAIGSVAVRLSGAEPAHALNLASAIEAALACGLIVLVAAELSGSVAAAIGAALLFAASYSFWSQAIIAEVYALHAALVALTLLLLLRWADAPSTHRLLAFLAAYALGFGNHLSMILLLPGYTLFLLLSAPRGWRSMFAPRIVAMAAACAVIGALQYAWNLRTLWLLPDPPHGIADALQRFWFDVTKSDWRDTMVMNVPQSLLRDHLAMYWFDLRQQFGIAGPNLAAAGMVQLTLADPRRAILMATLFGANAIFAFSYNVGDAHVFYLPSHVYIALLAAPAVTLAGRWTARATPVAALCLVLYAGSRGYRDFPALGVGEVRLQLESEHHIAQHVEPGKQRGLLKHDEPVAARALDGFAVSGHPALIGKFKAGDDAEQRRFPAAAGPDKAHELALANGQADVIQRVNILIPGTKRLGHVLDVQFRGRFGCQRRGVHQ